MSSVNEEEKKECCICLEEIQSNDDSMACIKCPNGHGVCFDCFAGSEHSHLYHSLEKIKTSKKIEEFISLKSTKSNTSDTREIQSYDNDDSATFDINHITSVLNGEIQIRCPHHNCKRFFTDISNAFDLCLMYFFKNDENSVSQFQELRNRYYYYKEKYAEVKGKTEGINMRAKMSEEQLECENLRNALGGEETRQCNKCGYGPLLHSKCSTLTTHQDEMRQGKNGTYFVIDNRCPKCGHMEDDWEQYPKWNGQFPTEEDKQIIKKKLEERKRDNENRISEQNDREFRLVMILDILNNEFNSMEFIDHEEIESEKRILQEELADYHTVESREKAREEELRRKLDEVTFQEILKKRDIDDTASYDGMCSVPTIDEPSKNMIPVKSDELQKITHSLEESIWINKKVEAKIAEIRAGIERINEMKARYDVFALRYQILRELSLEQLEEEYRKASRYKEFLSLNRSRQNGSFNARNHCRSYPQIGLAVHQEEQKARGRARRRRRQAQSNLFEDLNRLMGFTIHLTRLTHRGRNRSAPRLPRANSNMPTPIPIMNNVSVPAPMLVQPPSYVPLITPMPLLVPSPMHSSSNGEYNPLSSSAITNNNLLPLQQMQLQLLQQSNHTSETMNDDDDSVDSFRSRLDHLYGNKTTKK